MSYYVRSFPAFCEDYLLIIRGFTSLILLIYLLYIFKYVEDMLHKDIPSLYSSPPPPLLFLKVSQLNILERWTQPLSIKHSQTTKKKHHIQAVLALNWKTRPLKKIFLLVFSIGKHIFFLEYKIINFAKGLLFLAVSPTPWPCIQCLKWKYNGSNITPKVKKLKN